MDKSNILVILIGSIIIILFTFYSFGSFLSSSSLSPKIGTKVEPTTNSSDLQTGVDSSNKTNNTPLQMILYKNLEKPENYYLMKFPSYANVIHGNKSGSYIANLSRGNISVDLTDIPDTSSPELFFLSSIKPGLESSMKNFHQVGLNQSTINGNRAWDITYDWKNTSKEMESIKTLIEGTDEAAVITYSELKPQDTNNPTINFSELSPILKSFQWIGQQ